MPNHIESKTNPVKGTLKISSFIIGDVISKCRIDWNWFQYPCTLQMMWACCGLK